MDSLERLMNATAKSGGRLHSGALTAANGGRIHPGALAVSGTGSSLPRRALVHASLATTAAVGRRGRHLTGTFCLTGDTMEGIIQCLVFLKAFSLFEPFWSFVEYSSLDDCAQSGCELLHRLREW
uniref:Uncharacterized protein LOC114336584 n=1 Tax=Diabrotica virgifera virgifera TaxID=50390 RepID=A0A6P7GCZ3_DIAVI